MKGSADRLDRLAELRVPARLAAEWGALANVAIAVYDTSVRRSRRLTVEMVSKCLPPDGAGQAAWPKCLAAPGGTPAVMKCSQGRGRHLVFPVPSGEGPPSVYLITGELRKSGAQALSPERQELLRHFLGVAAQEMARFLETQGVAGDAASEFPELVGGSPAFEEVREELRRALPVRYPVLVLGESGTGKDLVAWLLHHRGPRPRREAPYVSLNVAALPDPLLESELFGHKRGAFTGADHDKPGLLEAARGGTLFLDEIQQMSGEAQAKLLRAVDTGDYMPLGGVRAMRSDARLVAATNADLGPLVASGRFRKDLYYRLSVLTIRMPSLREVQADIPRLVRHFVHLIGEREGLAQRTVAPEAMAALVASPWPGNVRQLIHELERALLRCAGGEVRVEHLSPELRALAPQQGGFGEMRDRVVEAWEQEQIREGLERTNWNVSRLAREFGLSRRGLVGKIARYGLQRPGSGTDAPARDVLSQRKTGERNEDAQLGDHAAAGWKDPVDTALGRAEGAGGSEPWTPPQGEQKRSRSRGR